MVSVKSSGGYALIVLPVATESVTIHRSWPAFHGQYGPRLFSLNTPGSYLDSKLGEIYAYVAEGNPRGLELWKEVDDQCDRRAGMVGICLECSICATPEGPHSRQIGLHSSYFTEREILDVLISVAETLRCPTRIIENIGDAYSFLV